MNRIVLSVVTALLLLGGCGSDNDDQVSKPAIDMDYAEAFPKNCVTVYRGESFEFKAIFSDEQELGNYNLEIHNNFDHHSHSTDDVACDLEDKKSPVNAFVYNKSFSIPSGQTKYNASATIEIPADIDTGDYHFMIRVTNQAAWQEIKGISIKISDRK
ncbi:DUF4625 domain-containing protein [Massilibacteroides sp.]|uniref:DUF4625 domain-containing protein n=1 Tax=Massilibacteroides sp. TaxID=2034766 RepID=UPI00262295F8|nr:DUF4625 domain-containing protein [Massilibacteroides sp.]MDD4514691.1 DUF4625 domain-containing protein [Massilibacteroides sp.]